MKTQILIHITLFLIGSIMFAQTQKATTESGVKVILNSDGTWDFDREKTEQKKISILDTIDCSKWISSEIDKVSGKIDKKFWYSALTDDELKGIFINFKKSHKGHFEIEVSVREQETENGFDICIKRPNITFLTTKNERIKFNSPMNDRTLGDENYGEDYCYGFTLVDSGVYGGYLFEDLIKVKVKMIRVYYDDLYTKEPTDVFLSEKEQEELWAKLNCLYK